MAAGDRIACLKARRRGEAGHHEGSRFGSGERGPTDGAGVVGVVGRQFGVQRLEFRFEPGEVVGFGEGGREALLGGGGLGGQGGQLVAGVVAGGGQLVDGVLEALGEPGRVDLGQVGLVRW